MNFFGPIIPLVCKCEGMAPGWGCVLQVLQNTINLGISLGIIFVMLALAYGGLLFILNSTNPGNLEKGRTVMLNSLIGLAVVLSAWLVVDFVMKTLYNEDSEFGPWNAILASKGDDLCLKAKVPTPLTDGVWDIVTGAGTGTGTVVDTTRGCPTCVSLSSKGISCKRTSSCKLNPIVADKLVYLNNNFEGTWTATEAYPPSSAIHSNQCHYNGTCIDAGFRGSTNYTSSNIVLFDSVAKKAGLRPVFETFDCKLRDAVRARGVTAFCSSDRGYGKITGSHFSLYGT